MCGNAFAYSIFNSVIALCYGELRLARSRCILEIPYALAKGYVSCGLCHSENESIARVFLSLSLYEVSLVFCSLGELSQQSSS